MRKIMRVLLAIGIGVMAVAAQATPAAAAPTDVLTTGSLGGPNVTVGDVLGAKLKSGTVVGFGPTITCTTSMLTFPVSTNPPAGGTATGSINAWSFGGCTSTSPVFTCVQAGWSSLPIGIGINGGSAVVTLGLTTLLLKFCTSVGTATCGYTASSVSAGWSNMDNSIAISANMIKSSGPGVCPSTFTWTVRYAPVKDTSVAGAPNVFAQ